MNICINPMTTSNACVILHIFSGECIQKILWLNCLSIAWVPSTLNLLDTLTCFRTVWNDRVILEVHTQQGTHTWGAWPSPAPTYTGRTMRAPQMGTWTWLHPTTTTRGTKLWAAGRTAAIRTHFRETWPARWTSIGGISTSLLVTPLVTPLTITTCSHLQGHSRPLFTTIHLFS